MHSIYLRSGRERSLQRRHPWLFSGAIRAVDGTPAIGETVAVRSPDGEFLAYAAFSPTSQIRVRVWSFDENEAIDAAFFRRRIERAVASRRNSLLDAHNNAYRLINAESDHLPGLIVDKYDDVLVMQCQSAGVEFHRDMIADVLWDLCKPRCVYERSDAEVRRLEGLEPRSGLLRGKLDDPLVAISENGVTYFVDVEKGHKTGFYLDQRDNRARVASLARDRSVLNCFSYTGGFALSALYGGAKSVVSVDTSAPALALGQKSAAANGFVEERHRWVRADCFDFLRDALRDEQKFSLIVLDPPKFAPSAHHVDKAARGYKDLNLRAMKLLDVGGLLFTFSCSGAIDDVLFRDIVAGAAQDAGIDCAVLASLRAGVDHPVGLHFSEGHYLKGLVVERRS